MHQTIFICLLFSPAFANLSGLWTSIPNGKDPLHDALRVDSTTVTCEDGGYLNLTSLDCSFTTATIILDSEGGVTFEDKSENSLSTSSKQGSYKSKSEDCDWVSKAPGAYWAGGFPPPFTPQCERIEWDDGTVWLSYDEIETVHLVSMSHLDVGYTGDISDTLNSYFTDFFPTAIRVQEEIDALRGKDGGDGNSDGEDNDQHDLHYVTHPWIVYLYINCEDLSELEADLITPVTCPTDDELTAFRAAVKRGTITWHAMPMNFQVEFMNKDIFNYALQLTHSLDDYFELPPKTVMSQRDVPGMTRGVVPELVKNGVSGITVGVNGGVCPPQVPNIFRWKVGEDSVVASWHPGGYPDEYACGGGGISGCNEKNAGPIARRDCTISGKSALCFQFRTDNTGPPTTPEEVLTGFTIAKTQFPSKNTKIIAGSLPDFFADAATNPDLPTVTGEIGDVWIPGIASDPLKASQTRRMQTAYSNFIAANGIESATDTSPTLTKSLAYLLKLTEHTWGLSDLANRSDDWTNAKLEEQYQNGDFQTNLDDWNVQRDFAKFAMESLDETDEKESELKSEFKSILDRSPPTYPNLVNFQKTADRTFDCGGHSLTFNPTGSVTIDQDLTLGEFTYDALGEDVYNMTEFVCDQVFGGKAGSKDYEGGETIRSSAVMGELYKAEGCDFWVTDITIEGVGAPKSSAMRFDFTQDGISTVTFNAYNKTRTRFNEAGWLTFIGASGDKVWSMTKLGHKVGMDESVPGGSAVTHSVDSVMYGDAAVITSLDAPVMSPINKQLANKPTVLLNDQQVKVEASDITGAGFNLWNNAWSTNYMFFYPFNDEGDENISYEFVVELSEKEAKRQ